MVEEEATAGEEEVTVAEAMEVCGATKYLLKSRM